MAWKHAAAKKWEYPDDYNVVLDFAEEIRRGERPPSDLVTVDAGFSASSRQLFEFSIIDRVNGKELINTVLDHPRGLNHRKDDKNYASNELLGFRERMSRHTASKVYSDSRTIDRMNVHQVARKLRESGISQNTINFPCVAHRKMRLENT